MSNSRDTKGSIVGTMSLFLTALIWGVAFVAQAVGMDHIEPLTFNGVRMIVAGIAMIPVLMVMKRGERRNRQTEQDPAAAKAHRKNLLLGGLFTGTALFVASSMQQLGIKYTSVGKAGFITAMYIVLVPVLSIFLRKRAGIRVWISVVIAVIGLYLLCITDTLSLSVGDAFVLGCAFVYAVQILCVDHFSPLISAVELSFLQLWVAGVLGLIAAFLLETPTWEGVRQAMIPILYCGIMSSGVGFTLQIFGQRRVNAAVASLIMSLESVISALAGWILLGQRLSPRELSGCIIIFAAIILAQLPERSRESEEEVDSADLAGEKA